jgi:hypothetical protein
MARFDIGGYTSYNVNRMARGRAPIRPSTFKALEDVGVFAEDFAFIEGSAAVRAAKLAKASEVKDYWVSIAPVRDEEKAHESKEPTARGTNYEGDYKASIKITEKDGVIKVGTDFYPLAMWLEWGTHKMKAAACGARTLEHFGGGAVDPEARITKSLFIG